MKSSSLLRTLQAASPSTRTRQATVCLRHAQRNSSRSLHTLPPNKHIRDNRIPGFLNETAYDVAWTTQQQWLIDNLNRLVEGTPEENMTPKDIAIRYARDANHAAAFNFASMAHNNHFFFQGINESPTLMSSSFRTELEKAFSSLESLRETMLATADSMFGPGFVWLVLEKDPTEADYRNTLGRTLPASHQAKKLRILTTYLAGSPYAGAHWRKQTTEAATTDFGVAPNESGPAMIARNPNFPTLGYMSQHTPSIHKGKSLKAPGAADVIPLLCVSTWEHAWLPQYGPGNKDEYLERWWDRIEWKTAEQHFTRR